MAQLVRAPTGKAGYRVRTVVQVRIFSLVISVFYNNSLTQHPSDSACFNQGLRHSIFSSDVLEIFYSQHPFLLRVKGNYMFCNFNLPISFKIWILNVLLRKVSDIFLHNPGGLQWSGPAWFDLEPHTYTWIFSRLSIASVHGKLNLSNVVFSALVKFSLSRKWHDDLVSRSYPFT